MTIATITFKQTMKHRQGFEYEIYLNDMPTYQVFILDTNKKDVYIFNLCEEWKEVLGTLTRKRKLYNILNELVTTTHQVNLTLRKSNNISDLGNTIKYSLCINNKKIESSCFYNNHITQNGECIKPFPLNYYRLLGIKITSEMKENFEYDKPFIYLKQFEEELIAYID